MEMLTFASASATADDDVVVQVGHEEPGFRGALLLPGVKEILRLVEAGVQRRRFRRRREYADRVRGRLPGDGHDEDGDAGGEQRETG